MIEAGMCGIKLLRESASEVFETMLFMDIEETPEPMDMQKEYCVLGAIAFQGKYEGTLSLLCTQPGVRTITANVLGLDDEDDAEEAQIHDAIGEVANMVLGAIKARLYKTAGDLRVEMPVVTSGIDIAYEIQKGDQLIAAQVLIDGFYPMELHLVYRNYQ